MVHRLHGARGNDAGESDPSTERASSPATVRTSGPTTGSAVVWGILCDALDIRVGAAGRSMLDILDAGGGTGSFAVPLAELGHRVTVVDRSPNALAALDRRAAEAGVLDRVHGRQGDIDGLLDVVGSASADVVLCHGVLEVADDPAAALAAMVGCLRPAGLLSVLAANRHAVVLSRALAGHLEAARHALADPAGRWGEGDPSPRRFCTDDLLALLGAAGLRVGPVHGVRIFTGLVPPGLLDIESDFPGALLALERDAAEHPAFREIAAQLHLLATLADVAGQPHDRTPPDRTPHNRTPHDRTPHHGT